MKRLLVVLGTAVIGLTAVFAFIQASNTTLTVANIIHAAPDAVLHVDGATGADSGSCGAIGTPCQTISHTLNSIAVNGDSILIAAGVYPENLTFSDITVNLDGGYAISGTEWIPNGGETIIDGGNINRAVFVHDSSVVTLGNMTLTHGRAPEEACWGGGFSVTNAEATLLNMRIRDNKAICTSGMSGGGGGGGLDINTDEGAASLYVENSIVNSNQAGDHGGALNSWQGTVVFVNTLFFANTSPVLGINETTFTMINSTIVDHDVDDVALLDFDSTADITVINTIIWESGSIVCGNGGGNCSITYSDVQGGWADTGNINADPHFVNPPSNDYHLQAWSAAIDAGTAVNAPAADFEGDPRPQNAGIDMGFDEFVGTPVTNEGDRYVAITGSDDGPNLCLDPGLPCRNIAHALHMGNDGEVVLVAEGTYMENIVIEKRTILVGGHDAATWQHDPAQYETIIDGSDSQTVIGDWDGNEIRHPRVIVDGGQYRMWYNGQNPVYPGWGWTMGTAESPDGINWSKNGSNPVLEPGDDGEWDSRYRGQVSILENSGLYRMWYAGSDGGVWQTGYATSTNGIDWTIYDNNPVLPTGAVGSWDEQEADGASVLQDGGLYHMWYHGCDDGYSMCSIGYATSTNGQDWVKHPANPVLTGSAGEWDDGFVSRPTVVLDGGLYKMWYLSNGNVGLATSPDGASWTKSAGNPVLMEGWDGVEIQNHTVITDNGRFKMWLSSGMDNSSGIGYAESTDGISWTMPISNPVIVHGTPGQWGEPVVRFGGGSDGAVLGGFTVTGGNGEFVGGIDAGDFDILIDNCIIHGNAASGAPDSQGGGGVLCTGENCRLTIVNSKIISNSVDEGASGIRVHGGMLMMENSVVAGNRGDMAVHLNGEATLMNVTIANNDGGILINTNVNSTLEIVNSIIYGNGWGVGNGGAATAHVIYSDIEGGWAGVGNIDADPHFVDVAAHDYHLQGSSPAIDAGTPAGAPPMDLDGTPRDAHPDMGAYEYERFNHDMAVVEMLPAGDVAVNIPFPIHATLYNVGSVVEDGVPTTCDIQHAGGTVYQQTINSGEIAPLTWQVLDFPTYTPTSGGAYTLTCQSALPSDGNPANDALSRTINALSEIADVWTKDNPDDNGDVPSDLNNWYESPDLWVRNTNDGGMIHQDPVAGVENYVYVRLRNRGTVAITGTVDVYWIEPSLGVRCGDWAYIDTVAFSGLLPGEMHIVNVPWTPTRAGHTCLQDVVDSPQDPYNRNMECSPLWVPWDNNVEWHNVNILSNPTRGLAGAMDIKTADVQLVNVYNLPQDVDLIIDRRTFPMSGTITVALPGELFDRWYAAANGWAEGITVLTATKEIQISGAISGTIGAIPMEAAEKAQVDLQFEGPAGFTFELAIRERIAGVTVGGLTYQWTIPDTVRPTVSTVSPSDADVVADVDTPIVVSFDEPIGSINFDLTVMPDPGGWHYYWNDENTAVTATHNAFARGTTYDVSVNASDLANNTMLTPFAWSFETSYTIFLPVIMR